MSRDEERRMPLENRLLTALPVNESKQLLPYLELTQLTYGEVLTEPGERIHHLFFPQTALISLMALTSEGATIEVGMIGREGMAGLPVFLGVPNSLCRTLVQQTGTAWRLTAAVFNRERQRQPTLNHLLQRYTYWRLMEASQSVACNRFHSVTERLCRWLLITHDRVRRNKLFLTQELLAHMLGVRRASIGDSIAGLQQRGLIQWTRGQIMILDRRGLEAWTCECYGIIKGEFEQLFGR